MEWGWKNVRTLDDNMRSHSIILKKLSYVKVGFKIQINLGN